MPVFPVWQLSAIYHSVCMSKCGRKWKWLIQMQTGTGTCKHTYADAHAAKAEAITRVLYIIYYIQFTHNYM